VRKNLALAGLFVLVSTVGSAQTYVANPSKVEFIPSADHSVTLPDGSPMVTYYEFRIYIEGAAAPMQVTNLGKPAPGTDGVVRAEILTVIGSLPLSPTTQYRATVAAIGPTGVGESTPSNPFGHVSGPKTPGSVSVKQ